MTQEKIINTVLGYEQPSALFHKSLPPLIANKITREEELTLYLLTAQHLCEWLLSLNVCVDEVAIDIYV